MSKKRDGSIFSEHRHCRVCGISINVDKQFCGEKCEETFKKERRKRRIIDISFIIFMIFLLFILFFPSGT